MQSRAWAITWRKWLLLAAFATTTGVCSLPAQTPEDAEIARAARQFRRQVYLNFRTDRGEFDGRRAAAAQAEDAYRDAGGSAEDADSLKAWLVAATSASANSQQLPATPHFGQHANVAESLPEVTSEPRGPLGPAAQPTPQFTAETDRVIIVDPLPGAPAVDPNDTTPPVTADLEVDLTPDSTDVIVDEPEAHHAATSAAPPVAEVGPLAEDATAAESPFESETEDAEVPLVESEPLQAPAAVEPDRPPAVPEPTASASSGVNLKELEARVSGHNFAVRAILLDWGRSAHGDVEQLATAVEQAASLGRRYGLLETYLNLLPQPEREQTGELEGLDGVFTTLGDAIADLRERYEESELPPDQRGAEVDRLNGLSRQLAEAFAAYDAETEKQP